MRNYKKLIFIGLIVLLGPPKLTAQSTYSTYSIIGIGDYIDPAVPAAMGMAGLGVSNGSYWYLNNTNPALLYYNQMALFTAGILAETKTINQQGFEPYRAGSGNLSNLAMAFPLVRNKWTFSLTLQPFTLVNYAFTYPGFSQGALANGTIVNRGEGGITSLNLNAGGKIYKGLSVGVKISYLFSSYQKQFSTIIDAPDPSYMAQYVIRQSISDFVYGLGVAYQQKLGEYQLNLGFIYDLPSELSGKEFIRMEQRTLANVIVFADTLVNDIPNKVNYPATLGWGISFGKPMKWLVGFDFKTQDWAQLQVPPESRPERFTRSRKYILGGEYTSDPMDVRSYLKRVTFRAGVSYEEKPYWLSGKQIKEIGINFGWSLPVSRFSSLDFGFMVGHRGTTEQSLVREDFFKIYFGATFNDNRWFLRPKFN